MKRQAEGKASDTDALQSSTFSQPTFGAVLLFSELSRPIQSLFVDFSLAAVGGQSLRELFGQAVPKLDSLDAALLQ